MTDKMIENERKVGSDCFFLEKSRRSNKTLDFYLNKFDINDYWIYKCSYKQYQVSIEDFYDFKYASYIFFKKDKYDNNEINEKLQTIWNKNITFIYLVNPLPPLEIIEKIKEKL